MGLEARLAVVSPMREGVAGTSGTADEPDLEVEAAAAELADVLALYSMYE